MLKRKPITIDDSALKQAMERSVEILERTAALPDDDHSKTARAALFVAVALGELVPLDDPTNLAAAIANIATRIGRIMHESGVHKGVFEDSEPGHAC